MSKKKRKIKGSRIRMLILMPISFLAVGYFLYILISYPYNIIKLKNEEKIYENQLLKLEIEKDNLKNEIEKLKDPDYLARYARENYQYSKDGEIILKIDKNKNKLETKTDNDKSNDITKWGIGILFLTLLYVFIKSRH